MLPRHPQPRARLPSVATSLPAPTTYLPTTHPLGAHAFPAPPTARAAAKRRNLPACPNGLLTYYSPACRPASLDLPDRTTSSPIVLMPALRVHGFAPNIISLPEMVRPRNRDGPFFCLAPSPRITNASCHNVNECQCHIQRLRQGPSETASSSQMHGMCMWLHGGSCGRAGAEGGGERLSQEMGPPPTPDGGWRRSHLLRQSPPPPSGHKKKRPDGAALVGELLRAMPIAQSPRITVTS